MKYLITCTVVLALAAGRLFADGIDQLLAHCAELPPGEERLELISERLFRIEDARIIAAFQAELSESTDRETFFVAWYLAKRGDRRALSLLTKNFYRYDCSSFEWSYILHVFGAFGYRPAIPNLIDSLNSASGNVVSESMRALRLFFPDAPEFNDLQEARGYFLARFREGEPGATDNPDDAHR